MDEQAEFAEQPMEEQVQPAAADAASDGGTTTVITIGATPPVIAGGLALAYLGVRRLRGGGGRAGQGVTRGVGDAATTVGSAAGQFVGTAAQTAGGAAQVVGENAGRAASTVAATGRQVRTRVTGAAGTVVNQAATGAREVPRLVGQNPALTLGLGIGVGAAIGLLVPATRREREVIGPASEPVIDQVRGTAQETFEKVQLVADEANTALRTSAREVGLVPVGPSGETGNGQQAG